MRKVYSPDIVVYSFEGRGGLIRTISFLLISPIRLVSRVMHNIFVMPANLQKRYADGLLVVATLTFALGLIDLFVYHIWCLAVSQIPLFFIALKLRNKAAIAEDISSEKREVDIDTGQVEELVETIYDDLDAIIK